MRRTYLYHEINYEAQTVTFKLSFKDAESVYLGGTFNYWLIRTKPKEVSIASGLEFNDHWKLEQHDDDWALSCSLALFKNYPHEFRFVINHSYWYPENNLQLSVQQQNLDNNCEFSETQA